MDIVLEAKDLLKIYRLPWRRQKIIALDHLNLKLKKGEIYGLLGPNGSGKTTAMKAFLGLLRLNSGEVRLFGERPSKIKIKSKIGFLPEESHFYKFLTAQESLFFFGQLAGLKKEVIRKKTDTILHQLDLFKVKDRWVRNFSKGMLRRLGFALILLKDPELIFLDEPTIGLDPIGTRQVREMMLDLKDRGKTILLSSHLLGEIEHVCDRIAILYQGRVLKEDRVENILQVTNKIQIILQKKDEVQIQQLKTNLEQLGMTVESIGHPRKTLENTFLETIYPNP
jgi:ABC-2 type transport system ATP-binding protein